MVVLYRLTIGFDCLVVDMVFVSVECRKMPRYDDRYGGTRLYVGRLASRTRSRDLEDLFARYGR